MKSESSPAGVHGVNSQSGISPPLARRLSALGVLLLGALAAVAALTAFGVMAQSSDRAAEAPAGSPVSSRIGFVDIPYLIDRAPQALEAEQRLEAEFAPRQEELEVQRAERTRLAERLDDVSLELADDEREQLDREMRGLDRRIKRSEQDFREELNIQKNDEFKNVRVVVLEAIASFGKQHDYDLIVSDGVLFANQRIDVTERILESLLRENARRRSAN